MFRRTIAFSLVSKSGKHDGLWGRHSSPPQHLVPMMAFAVGSILTDTAVPASDSQRGEHWRELDMLMVAVPTLYGLSSLRNALSSSPSSSPSSCYWSSPIPKHDYTYEGLEPPKGFPAEALGFDCNAEPTRIADDGAPPATAVNPFLLSPPYRSRVIPFYRYGATLFDVKHTTLSAHLSLLAHKHNLTSYDQLMSPLMGIANVSQPDQNMDAKSPQSSPSSPSSSWKPLVDALQRTVLPSLVTPQAIEGGIFRGVGIYMNACGKSIEVIAGNSSAGGNRNACTSSGAYYQKKAKKEKSEQSGGGGTSAITVQSFLRVIHDGDASALDDDVFLKCKTFILGLWTILRALLHIVDGGVHARLPPVNGDVTPCSFNSSSTAMDAYWATSFTMRGLLSLFQAKFPQLIDAITVNEMAVMAAELRMRVASSSLSSASSCSPSLCAYFSPEDIEVAAQWFRDHGGDAAGGDGVLLAGAPDAGQEGALLFPARALIHLALKIRINRGLTLSSTKGAPPSAADAHIPTPPAFCLLLAVVIKVIGKRARRVFTEAVRLNAPPMPDGHEVSAAPECVLSSTSPTSSSCLAGNAYLTEMIRRVGKDGEGGEGICVADSTDAFLEECSLLATLTSRRSA